MKKLKKLILLILLLLSSSAAMAQEISNIAFESNVKTDKITISLDSSSDPKVFSLGNPTRIVLDFETFLVAKDIDTSKYSSDIINSIRAGKNDTKKPKARIVIDLKQDAEAKVLSENDGKRIILELKKGTNSAAYTEEILSYVTGQLPKMEAVKRFYIMVNGKKLDMGKKAIYVKKNLMVPAKDFFEKAGFIFILGQNERSVTAQLGKEIEIRIKAGESVMVVNGKERDLSSPLKRFNGQLYLPLESVTRNIGYGIVWSEKDKAVYCSPRLDKIDWKNVDGGRSLVIGTSHKITSYEYGEKKDPIVGIITLPNHIVDIEDTKIFVKENEVMGIKVIQVRNDAKIIIYMSENKVPKIKYDNKRMTAFFEETKDQGFDGIKNITITTSEALDSVYVNMDSAIDPRIFQLEEPPRIVMDFKGAKCSKGNNEIDAGSRRVSKIRWALNGVDQESVRIVIDLIKETNVEVVSDNSGKRLIVKLKDKSLDLRSEKSATDYKNEIKPYLGDTMPKLFIKRTFLLNVNGEKLDLGKNAIFVKKNLMVPAKDFFEKAGFIYTFDAGGKNITAQYGKKIEVNFKYNDTGILVNGIRRELTSQMKRYDGRIYLPLEAVARNIGYGFAWDEKTKKLSIAPVIQRVQWKETPQGKAIEIESNLDISTFEYTEKTEPICSVITVPNTIVDIAESKITVKEDNVLGIKAEQFGNNSKITLFLSEKQESKVLVKDNILTISYPPIIKGLKITEEGKSIVAEIFATKGIVPDVKRFSDPDRIIIDIPNAIYKGPVFQEINKGGMLRMRASQFKTDPFISRIVFDLAKDLNIKASISENNKHFSLVVEKQEVKIKETEKIKILDKKVIVIDPGHGGEDTGAFGYSGENVMEKDLNLKVAHKLARLLSDAGAIIQMTREDDRSVSLKSRVDFARTNDADIFVAVHHNAIYKPAISGTETYYYNRNSKLLAKLVHNNMVSKLRQQDRGLSRVKFFVVFKTTMPSVLVEPLYISNPEEELLARDPIFQQRIAESIFNGIKQYFEILKKLG